MNLFADIDLTDELIKLGNASVPGYDHSFNVLMMQIFCINKSVPKYQLHFLTCVFAVETVVLYLKHNYYYSSLVRFLLRRAACLTLTRENPKLQPNRHSTPTIDCVEGSSVEGTS